MTTNKEDHTKKSVKQPAAASGIEQELRQSRKKLLLVFNKAPFPMSFNRLSDGVFVEINDAWVETFGFSRAETIGKTPAETGIVESAQEQALLFSQLQENGFLQNIETAGYRTKKNTALAVVLNLELFEIDGEKHVFTAVQDRTECKRIEDNLKEYNDHLRMALEATQLGTWKYNPRTREIFWDERSRKILGALDELKDNTKFMELVHPEDRTRVIETVRDGLNSSKGVGVIDFRVVRGDGEIRWVNITGKSYFDWIDGRYKAVHAIGTNMDITERKQAEEALRESEERLRLATEAADMHGWEVDLSSGVFKPSQDVDHGVIYPKPKNISEAFEFVHPEDRAALKSKVFQAIEKNEEFRVEYRIKRASPEKEIWHFSAGMTIAGTGGKPARVVGVTQNITERKKAEKMLRRWNESLEQQVAERTELAEARAKQLQALALDLVEAEEKERKRIAVLLHDDLQQLLVSARLQQQTACNTLPEGSPLLPMFMGVDAIIEESIEKSRHLSHELSPPVLHHSGLIAGLNWLVRQMKDQFGLHVELEADVVVSMEDSPLKVFLFRAVQELLFNIVKHAGEKKARVSLVRSERDLTITIIDEGRGFDPTILETSFPAKGFGLISLRERTRAFGGNLMIESAPAKGSKFVLSVPLSLAQAQHPLSFEQSIDPRKRITQTQRMFSESDERIRVLFVDDHLVMRQALIAMLHDKADIQVIGEAADGLEAIEQVRALNPEVVVMDVSMPKMDGVEATRRIKERWPEIRIIGLSMYDDDQIVQTMQQAGADAFLSKTASSFELRQAIHGMPSGEKV